MKSNTRVLYHDNCPDGFAAAWVARQHLGPDAHYIPVQYGQPIPQIPDGSLVYILDFSYPRIILDALANRCALTVIDHHKTAEQELSGASYATFHMGKSGCVLTWEHFNHQAASPSPHYRQNAMRPPDLLLYVEDRDLWKFQLPNSEEVSYALRSYPYDFETWDNLVVEPITGRLAKEGVAIMRFVHTECERIARHARIVSIGGAMVPACTASCFFSELGEWLVDNHEAPFAAVWFQRADGKFIYSLRSRVGFDVSAIAKQYGGGGHKNAAGFESDTLL